MQTILDNVGNKIGRFVSARVKPPVGAKSVTITAATTDLNEVSQVSADNACCIGIRAATNGREAHTVGWSHTPDAPWTSGSTGTTPPSATYAWDPAPPPDWIEGVLDNPKQTPFGLAVTWGF